MGSTEKEPDRNGNLSFTEFKNSFNNLVEKLLHDQPRMLMSLNSESQICS